MRIINYNKETGSEEEVQEDGGVGTWEESRSPAHADDP